MTEYVGITIIDASVDEEEESGPAEGLKFAYDAAISAGSAEVSANTKEDETKSTPQPTGDEENLDDLMNALKNLAS